MNAYETELADLLTRQFGPNWYMHGAHPQTVADYVQALTHEARAQARDTMKRDAVVYAHGVIQAALSAGIVKAPQ